MKKIVLIILVILSQKSLIGQDDLKNIKTNIKSFPKNIYIGNDVELEKLDGKTVAFDGTIEQIEKSRNNTPFYKLKVSDSTHIWTVLMFDNKKNNIGDKIRVIGYLFQSEPNESEKKFLESKCMVVSFGLVDFKNSFCIFPEKLTIQKQ